MIVVLNNQASTLPPFFRVFAAGQGLTTRASQWNVNGSSVCLFQTEGSSENLDIIFWSFSLACIEKSNNLSQMVNLKTHKPPLASAETQSQILLDKINCDY